MTLTVRLGGGAKQTFKSFKSLVTVKNKAHQANPVIEFLFVFCFAVPYSLTFLLSFLIGRVGRLRVACEPQWPRCLPYL